VSYLFDGVNDGLTGTFTSTYTDPITLACFVKVAAHPVAFGTLVQIGNSNASIDETYTIRTSSTDDLWEAVSRNTLTSNANVTLNIDGVWAGIIGVFINDSLRELYLKTTATMDSNTGNRPVADVNQFISIGLGMGGAQDFTGNIAEAAIWNKALTSADITRYLAGVRALRIAPANLIGYWPLSASNATQENLGVDTGGDLTVTAALFDADHPVITDSEVVSIPGRRTYVMP
jgi:hypothetical protein